MYYLSQSSETRFHYGPHFADKETGSERLSNFPKATELVIVRAGIDPGLSHSRAYVFSYQGF